MFFLTGGEKRQLSKEILEKIIQEDVISHPFEVVKTTIHKSYNFI